MQVWLIRVFVDGPGQDRDQTLRPLGSRKVTWPTTTILSLHNALGFLLMLPGTLASRRRWMKERQSADGGVAKTKKLWEVHLRVSVF